MALIPPPPWVPAKFDVADAAALQALSKGEATPDQQQRALNWIVYSACGTYDLEYRPDTRDHAFASGKRSVGLQIISVLKTVISKLKEAKTNAIK